MSNNPVLDYLREQFTIVDAKLDHLQVDVTDLKGRMTALEIESGHVRVELAAVNNRVDRMEARVDRIERRLDLVEAPEGVRRLLTATE